MTSPNRYQPHHWIAALFFVAFSVIHASEAQAQPDGNWVRTSATVSGVFDFQINGGDRPQAAPAVYDFGAVSHTGMNGGILLMNRAYYRADGAFSWSVRSAPRRTVDISFQNATKLAGPALGPMDLDQLAVRLTVTGQASGGTGTTTGLKSLTSGKVLLVDDVRCGMGTSAGRGNIDLELYVDASDKEGLNTWEIQLVAEGV